MIVHRVGGVEDGGGLRDGLDMLDPVCAVVTFLPMLFVDEELCNGVHDRFLSKRSAAGLPWGVQIGVVADLVNG